MANTDFLQALNNRDAWPELPYEAWKDTYHTLHMWMQIIGKIRLALSPMENHWWNVPLIFTARGFTTSAMPYQRDLVAIDFDFIDHQLLLSKSDGTTRSIPLQPRTVADFYGEVMSVLRAMGVEVKIWTMPVEIPDPIAFEQDREHSSYDAEYVRRFWQIVRQSAVVLESFRGRFIGKASRVHFFWGSFDLAASRYSGKEAPPRRMDDKVLEKIMNEAYSHEVSSAGWWPGGGTLGAPAYYAYHTPEPEGYSMVEIQPLAAWYHRDLGEYLLLYDDMRRSATPVTDLLAFLQTTYEAGAILAKWDRAALER